MISYVRNMLRGFTAVFYKETLHMRRDRMAIMFALFVPLIEMVILGAAIDTNVRQLPTVIFDDSGIMTQAYADGSPDVGASSDSRALLDRLRNSDTFKIYKFVDSDEELNEEMVSGRAKVAIKIPKTFDRDLIRGDNAQLLVMVDGSESSSAGQAVNVSAAIGLDESLRRVLPQTATALPVDVRPKIMFNPDSRSANFFIPGLLAVLLLMITTMLTAFAVVREKEKGTLEQLLVTPVQPLGLMLGKIMPYFFLGWVELQILVAFMHFVFRVPIHGNLILLNVIASTYMMTNLAIGMLLSVKANSQSEAMQSSMSIMLPSIFLSGYVFPRDTMPWIFKGMSYFVPATYMIDTMRGIILRGAEWHHLWVNAAVLTLMAVVIMMIAAKRFRKMYA